jgi:hypothetical protein
MAPSSTPRPRQNMTRKRVTLLMRSSRTEEEWRANRDAVTTALGYRPPYWNLDIIGSGVMERSMRVWPTNSITPRGGMPE